MDLKPIFDQAGIAPGEVVHIALDCSTMMPQRFYVELREAMRAELHRVSHYAIYFHDTAVRLVLNVDANTIDYLFSGNQTLPIGAGCMYAEVIDMAQSRGATTLFMITDAYGVMPPLVVTMDIAIFTFVPEQAHPTCQEEFALRGPVHCLNWEGRIA